MTILDHGRSNGNNEEIDGVYGSQSFSQDPLVRDNSLRRPRFPFLIIASPFYLVCLALYLSSDRYYYCIILSILSFIFVFVHEFTTVGSSDIYYYLKFYVVYIYHQTYELLFDLYMYIYLFYIFIKAYYNVDMRFVTILACSVFMGFLSWGNVFIFLAIIFVIYFIRYMYIINRNTGFLFGPSVTKLEFESQMVQSNHILESEHLELAFNLFCFYKDFTRDNTIASRSFAILRYIKNYYTFGEIFNIMSVVVNQAQTTMFMEPQSFSPSTMRSALNNWKDLSSSDLVEKTSTVLSGLMASSLTKKFNLPFTKEGNSEYLRKYGKSVAFKDTNDMLTKIAEMIVTFAEVGYECFCDNSLRPILIRDRSILSWIDSVNEVVTDLDSLPVTDNFDHNLLLQRLNAIIARGNALMKEDPRTIAPYNRDLMTRRSRLMKEFNVSSTRRAPFSVLVHGTPGIGKSTVTQLLGTIYHRTVTSKGIYPNLEWDPKKNTYTYNCDDEYWSGYKGAQQWFICMDDLARENAKHVAGGQTTSIKDVISIVNSVGMATTQAAIEDKGVIPLIPKMVVATTNIKDLNARHAVAEESAVLRRFPYVIKPVLKPEYLDLQTGMMKKVDHVVHDAWDYLVEKVHLNIIPGKVDTIKVSYLNVCPRACIEGEETLCTGAEMSEIIARAIIKHEKSSGIMQDSLEVDEEVEMCEHGVVSYFTCHRCPQVEPQAEVEEDGFGFLRKYLRNPWGDREPQNWPGVWQYVAYMIDKMPPWEENFKKNWNSIIMMKGRNVDKSLECYPKLFNYLMRTPWGRRILWDLAKKRYKRSVPKVVQKYQKMFAMTTSALIAIKLGAVVVDMYTTKKEKKADEEMRQEEFSPQGNIWAQAIDFNALFSPPPNANRNNYQELLQSIKKSMFRLGVQVDGTTFNYVNAISIGGSRFLTVNHIFPVRGSNNDGNWQCIAQYGLSQAHVSSKQGFTLTPFDIKRLPNDTCIFTTSNVLPRRDILKFFPEHMDESGRKCGIVGMTNTGEQQNGNLHTVKMIAQHYRADDGSMIAGTFMHGNRLDRPPQRGDCGSVVISESRGYYYISGIHTAGTPNGTHLLISQLSQEILRQEQEHVLAMSDSCDDDYFQEGSANSGPMGPPATERGIHHWVDKCHAVVLGSFQGRATNKCFTRKTVLCDDLCDILKWTNEFVRPPMRGFKDKCGNWFNPFTVAAVQQGTISPYFTEDEVLQAAHAFTTETTWDDESNWLKDAHIISPIEVAINGIEGDSYINRLPMSTSGGFFFPGAKKKYFDHNEETDKYTMKEDVEFKFNKILDTYKSGRRCGILFNGTLKDEPIKQKKADAGKTRVFTACDVAFSIVVRQQYLQVTKAIMKNNFISESAVAMNCYSYEWERLHDYLVTFGEDKIIAGDYASFDKKMPPVLIRAAFNVLDCWRAWKAPLSRENMMISRGIATDISYPVTNMNGDVFQFFGGNSSGHPLTVIINSIVNSLYMRVCYSHLGYKLPTFKQHVKLMTLGDDNIMGTDLPGFNHTAIAEVLRRKGVPYTMADKEAESVPYINIKDADFLKRKFVRSHDGKIIAPLNITSTYKSLCMMVEKGNIGEYQQIAQSYLSARREWSLHGIWCFDRHSDAVGTLIHNKHPLIEEHFIRQHKYNWETTYAWVTSGDDPADLETESEEESVA